MAIEALVRWLLMLLGMKVGEDQDVLSAREELRGAVDLLHREGDVETLDRDMFGGVLDLRELVVSDVMIHRTDMITLDVDEPPEDVVNAVIASPVTRIPLWRGNPENIIGVLHVKDLLRALHAVDGDAAKVDVAGAGDAGLVRARNAPVVASSSRRSAAARRRSRWWWTNMARSQGLVTLEDILEEIVGDITDEHDIAMPGVRKQPDGSVNVDGAVTIRDLNRVMDWNLPDEEATTIAGLVIHEARSIPEVGPELHLPRLPLPGAAPRAQPHHRAAHSAAAAQGRRPRRVRRRLRPGAAAWMASA